MHVPIGKRTEQNKTEVNKYMYQILASEKVMVARVLPPALY